MVLRKSFYPQYGRACFITGIKEGMFITMIMRALTHGVRSKMSYVWPVMTWTVLILPLGLTFS